MNLDQNILSVLGDIHKDGILICAIQFGSSVYSSESCNDIDIALVIKDEELEKFANIAKTLFTEKYDISLILESEVTQNFYFGNHGIYLIEAFKNGITLVGINIFVEKYKQLNGFIIRKAVFERMREYVYILRKSYFVEDKNALFLSRYIKFLRLALFLDEYFNYQESMMLKKDNILNFYKKNIGVDIENTSILEKKLILEKIWKRLKEKYS